MKTDIKADLLIYKDKSKDLKKAVQYVAKSGFDGETKEYYDKMIRIKKAYNKLKPDEQFLFDVYFFTGFELEVLPELYKLKKCKLSKDVCRWREILAMACARFCAYASFDCKNEILITAIICSGKYLLFDTFKYNIDYILQCKNKDKRAFELICRWVEAYDELSFRAVEVLYPQALKIIKCKGLDKNIFIR